MNADRPRIKWVALLAQHPSRARRARSAIERPLHRAQPEQAEHDAEHEVAEQSIAGGTDEDRSHEPGDQSDDERD